MLENNLLSLEGIEGLKSLRRLVLDDNSISDICEGLERLGYLLKRTLVQYYDF